MSDLVRVNGEDLSPAVLESVLLDGDLARLKPQERISYMMTVCKALGLNPLTKPFEFTRLNNRLVMYARKECTEQLRKLHGISVKIVSRELADDVYVVTAQAVDRAGRSDESIGAVNVAGLRGEAKANALMKAETKAKRRVTLSISGLGMLDESEIDDARADMPKGARMVAAHFESLAPKAEEGTSSPSAELANSGDAELAEPTKDEIQDLVECWRWVNLGGSVKAGTATGEWISLGMEPRRTNAQNAAMHAGRAKVGATEDQWRKKLSGTWNKTTSADLSVREATEMLAYIDERLRLHGTAEQKRERQARKAANVPPEIAELAREREPGEDDA